VGEVGLAMIGVSANADEHEVVHEFFELFKTPWEFCRPGRRYDVLLAAGGERVPGVSGRLEVVYSGGQVALDEQTGNRVEGRRTGAVLPNGGSRIPIYGEKVTFRTPGIGPTSDEIPFQPAAYAVRTEAGVVVRVGYDLFREVRALLSEGQPPANADMPTLELHIALLRDLILANGVPLVEIPPAPDGYPLIACLTHDVDHPSIRRHRWDHTTFGFLYRACLGSLINAARGRMPVGDLLTNWAAALRLPFVHLGLAKDFWSDLSRYRAIDPGAGSTFFVIPVKGYPGRTDHGAAPRRRAASYGASDIADELRQLAAAGCEIGVHGIDAWMDSSRGHEELREICRITGASEVGVRMHWLYAGEKSPAILEQAGFSYDSTSGYNQTVGYRAGTTQVFRPPGATSLLELPLHVMDTALFYPAHLDLSPKAALARVRGIIERAVRFGGAVTVNWHDRSNSPERLWGRVYGELVRDLKARGAWFPTASQAVSWFRKRRAAVFESVTWESGGVRARVSVDDRGRLPGLRLRIHKAREHGRIGTPGSNEYVDIALNESIDARIRV
jgi:hypothetical protein